MYENLFTDLQDGNSIWKTLTRNFFQKYIDKNDSVLDYGSGYCEFINNISCRTRFAHGLNQSFKKYADKYARFLENDKFPIDINEMPKHSFQ